MNRAGFSISPCDFPVPARGRLQMQGGVCAVVRRVLQSSDNSVDAVACEQILRPLRNKTHG